MKNKLNLVSSIWKMKAKSRRLENVDLQKRMEELVESREGRKRKASERKEELNAKDTTIEKLRQELDRIKKTSKRR